MAQASDDLIGGVYQKLEDLGVGGYSRVLLASSTKTNDLVAVKILLSEPKKIINKDTNVVEKIEWIISESKVKQCTREMELMQKIKHSNVVQLIDFMSDATFPGKDELQNKMVDTPCLCVVLEYCARGELFDYLMYAGGLGSRVTRTYFHQFLNGLSAMHEAGYVHRDLKPENLLLDDNYNLKIADFGFATPFKDQSGKIQLTTTCGTRGYLAPELIRGEKYTNKVDLFAVGIIMFTTFAGFPPFQHAGKGDWWWDKMNKSWQCWQEAASIPDDTEENKKNKNAKIQKGNQKMKLFWSAHERSCKFSDSFKHLMQYLLNPNPKIRYDIKDCFEHPWLKGKTLSSSQLKRTMKKLKGKVDKQRALKIKDQLRQREMMETQSGQKKEQNGRGFRNPEATIARFKKLANEYDKVLENKTNIKENTAIVNKARFQIISNHSLNNILSTIDTVARAHQCDITFDPTKAEFMIRGTVTRWKNINAKEKYNQGESLKVKVKIIYEKNVNMSNDDNDDDKDDDDNFVTDSDDENEEVNDVNNTNDNDDNKQADSNTNTNTNMTNNNSNNNNNNNTDTSKRYIIVFWRIEGSADGYQNFMAHLFYDERISSLLDLSAVISDSDVNDKSLRVDRKKAPAAFASVFSQHVKPSDDPNSAEEDHLPDANPIPIY